MSPEDVARDRRAGTTLGVVLVEPLHVVRAGLALLVRSRADMHVAAEAADAEEALAAIRKLRRRSGTVVLISLGLHGERDAFWLVRTIRDEAPALPIVVTGGGADDAAISRALFMGADGFVNKNLEPASFLDALRRARVGEVLLEGVPPGWLGSIAGTIDRQRELAPVLTERELEVLSVAAEGLTARQIGRRLGIRERTATTHLARIYDKLGVRSRTAAVATAARSGLVALAVGE